MNTRKQTHAKTDVSVQSTIMTKKQIISRHAFRKQGEANSVKEENF